MRHIPRFYISGEFFEGAVVTASELQFHHAVHVLRKNIGDEVKVFNETQGEWSGTISNLKKRQICCVKLIKQAPKIEREITVAFPMINPSRMSFLLEKITELGVTKIILLTSEYSQARNFNSERLKSIVIGACEQCGRLNIPEISPPISLQKFLSQNSGNNEKIVLLDEVRDDKSKRLSDFIGKKCVFLIGPEGGFSDAERELFSKYDFIEKISLGENILRTETAVIVCVAFQTML